MNLLLCACDGVGLETARFLKEAGDFPACLVLDSEDRGAVNDELLNIFSGRLDVILYSEALKADSTLDRLIKMELDLGVLAWWPYIIKKRLIEIPRLGFINFHPGYLPYQRGKDPNFWALATGTPFGVTIHHVNEQIDAGGIIARTKIEPDWEDTGQTLYEKGKIEMLRLFKKIWSDIRSGNMPSIPEDTGDAGDAYLHYRKDLHAASRIDMEKKYTARDLLNLIRARTFPPHPAAWFEERGKIFEVRVEIREKIQGRSRQGM